MLRITEENSSDSAMTLRLEGRLIGAWVELLNTTCTPWLERDCELTLDLTGVSFADHEGVALLIKLAQQQVALNHCSPFLQEQLKPVATGQLAHPSTI